jgi:hypothetical protein
MPDPFKSHWPPLRPGRSSGRTPTPTVTHLAANRGAATDGTTLQSLHPNAAETAATTGAEAKTRRVHDREKNAGRRHSQQDAAVKPTASHDANRSTAARNKNPKTSNRTVSPNAATHPQHGPPASKPKKPQLRREVRHSLKTRLDRR